MSIETRIVQNRFGSFKRKLSDEVRLINAAAARVQASIQIQLCPISTLDHVHLVETIKVENRGRSEVVVLEGDAEHYYWLFVEYGTVNMEARPHIRPAHQAALKYRRDQLAKLATQNR